MGYDIGLGGGPFTTGGAGGTSDQEIARRRKEREDAIAQWSASHQSAYILKGSRVDWIPPMGNESKEQFLDVDPAPWYHLLPENISVEWFRKTWVSGSPAQPFRWDEKQQAYVSPRWEEYFDKCVRLINKKIAERPVMQARGIQVGNEIYQFPVEEQQEISFSVSKGIVELDGKRFPVRRDVRKSSYWFLSE